MTNDSGSANIAPTTLRDSRQVFDLCASIKTKVDTHLSKNITRRKYDAIRLLSDLPIPTLSRIDRLLDSLLSSHVYRFLTHTNMNLTPEFINAYLDLLPQLTEKQRFIATDYFTTLARWLTGSPLPLDLMVRFSTQYREATGLDTLPYTTEADQRLFARLSKELHLMDPILERVDHTSQITPELLNELAKVHPALLDGSL